MGGYSNEENSQELLPPSQLSGRDEVANAISIGENNNDPQLRRSTRSKIPKRRFAIENEVYIVTPHDDKEPKTVKEELECPAKEKWKVALEDEMESLKVNQVWTLVDLPPGRKAIGNKWILKLKRKVDGSIDKYKAQLMVKGYTQQEGINYEETKGYTQQQDINYKETFSLIVRFTFIRLILAIVAHMDLELHQMDVKMAFLNR